MYYYPRLEGEDLEAWGGIYLPWVSQLASAHSRASAFNNSAIPHIPAFTGWEEMGLPLSKTFYETQGVVGMETLVIFLNYVIRNLF